MMKLLLLANRNLWRNKRRSLITLIAISFGLASLIFIWSFIDGMNEQIVDNSTSYLSSHIKIHRRGYHGDKVLYLSMPEDRKLQKSIGNNPDIVAITPRVEGKAMLSGDQESRGVIVLGVDSESEPDVTTLSKSISLGRYLQKNDSNSIVIGDLLAEKTGLSVGDAAVLVSQARDGSVAADKFRIVGIYNSGIDMIDSTHIFIPLKSAQEFYSLWGQITAWAIRLNDRSHVPQVTTQLKELLGRDYEVLGWKKLLPDMVQVVRFHEIVSYVIIFIVIVVVTVGVANTILMVIMERTREFGIMLALGTSQNQVIQLVLLESFLLGLIGVFIGNLLGIAVTSYFGINGVDFSEYSLAMETMPGLSAVVKPFINTEHVFFVSAITFLVSIIPALIPAWKVSRLQPIEAINGNIQANRALQLVHGFIAKKINHESSGSHFLFWRVALRSIWRNPRRSLLTISATAFGLAAFIYLYAFTDGFFEQMVENSIKYSTAHVQLAPLGFQNEFSARYTISEDDKVLKKTTHISSIQAAAPRIQVEAMISSANKTEPIILNGIQPGVEQKVTKIQDVIVNGRYLQNVKYPEIMLGVKLVDKLGIQPGEKVVITSQTAAGTLATGAYRLSGVYRTGNELFDGSLAFITLLQAQQLLDMQGKISTLAIRLKDRTDSKAVAHKLNKMITANTNQARPWEDVLPVLVQMIDVSKLSFFIVLVIVFIVVAVGVMNTLLMSVLERTREFGMMLAVGTEPLYIVRMVIYESIILGLIGVILGTIIGVSLTYYYHSSGMNLSGFSGAMNAIPGMTDIVYPVLIFDHLWPATLILFATGVVAALYPAGRAASLEPVEALHHV